MPRISERDFVLRHAAQRLRTQDLQSDPALTQAGIPQADTNQDGLIEGDGELKAVYQRLLSLGASSSSSSSSSGVDLDAPAVKPVYNALTARFAQRTGTEAALGATAKLADVPELAAVAQGVASLSRRAGEKQLGVGSVQDALLVVAAAEEAQTGRTSLLRVNLGTGQQNRGLFGPGTEAAVVELRRRAGLPPQGTIDQDTLRALDAELARVRTAATGASSSTSSGAGAGSSTSGAGTSSTSSGASAAITHGRFAATASIGTAFVDVLQGRAVLRAGDTGAAVTALQQALLDMGFSLWVLKNDAAASGVDGSYGDQTATALRNFQIHAAKRGFSDVRPTGVLDDKTLRALLALAPSPGKKAWDAGERSGAPTPRWSGDPSKALRIVAVKDEHRTFLFDRQGACVGIFANAHGSAGNETDTGLKKITARLDENVARSTGQSLWGTPRAFGKRILDLSWASGGRSGEELHGTYDYKNLGKDVSHGCVRHRNEDIITMFDAVSVGELVAIVSSIDEPLLR